MYQNFDLRSEGIKLKGYLWGLENPKRVVCIIHGIGEHAGRYDRVSGYLNDAGIAVIAMDLRGHGLSDGKPGHTYPRIEVLDDISLMIEKAGEMYPGVPIILYGHSMGGNLCLDYRSRGPLNDVPVKYIVSGPWLKLVNAVPKPVVSVLTTVSKAFPEFKMSSGCDESDLGNLEFTGGYNEDPLVHTCITIGTAADCMDFADKILRGKNENNGRAIDKPLLLMHGGSDKICDVKGSRALAAIQGEKSNFKYIEWPGYYHEIHNGGPDATGEEAIMAIRDFVLE